MKKNLLLVMTLLALAGTGYSQTGRNTTASQETATEIYTPLKPKDGQPAVFTSQEELNGRVQDKKNAILAQIKANSSDAIKVKQFREELWRFENAVVQASK